MSSNVDTEFETVRRRVLRKTIYAVNTHALLERRVSADGAFDAAAANGLAAIRAYREPGAELTAAKHVKAPLQLLQEVRDLDLFRWEDAQDADRLRGAILVSQSFRHGRADDEWVRLGSAEVQLLAALDRSNALGVLESTRALNFDQAVETLWWEEIAEHVGWSPQEGDLDVSSECGFCNRPTVLSSSSWSSLVPGPGRCIACGGERTLEDVDREEFAALLDDPNA